MMQGDVRWAAALLEESLPLAQSLHHPYTNAWALNHLGHLAEIEADYTRATQLHTESLGLFRQYSEQHDRTAWALHDLGESVLAQNDLVEARAWLVASLRQFHNLGDRAGVSWCLAGLGSAAARLWGAAERLRQTIGCRPAPAAHATYERALALVRTRLSDDRFTAAWAVGTGLLLDEAIAEALGSWD